MKSLRAVIYGQAGIGKTTAIETAPGPRLIFDSEGGSDWLEKPTVSWDDVRQPPPTSGPEGAGRDYNVVVFIRDWATFQQVEAWLQSGQHNFRTVALDSLTDIQKRCKDNIATGGFDQQAWGTLLDTMDVSLRRLRDLTKHRTNPLLCIIITALVRKNTAGLLAPRIQGGLADELPGLFDLVGYMYASTETTVDGDHDRLLAITPSAVYEAKDRTKLLVRHYGTQLRNPNFTEMLRVLNPKTPAAPAAPTEESHG